MMNTQPQQDLSAFIRQFKSKADLIACEQIYLMPNIPYKKLQGANTYLPMAIKQDELVLILDDTVFGSAKVGVSCTTHVLFYKAIFEDLKAFYFEDITHVEYQSGVLSQNIILNQQHELSFTQLDQVSVRALAELIHDYARSLQKNDPSVAQSPTRTEEIPKKTQILIHYYSYLHLKQQQHWDIESVVWMRQVFVACSEQVKRYMEAQMQEATIHPYSSLMQALVNIQHEFDLQEKLHIVEDAMQAMCLNHYSDHVFHHDLNDLQKALQLSDAAIDHVVDLILKYQPDIQQYFTDVDTDVNLPAEIMAACQCLDIAPAQLSMDVLKRAYRKKIADFHPDQYQNLPQAVKTMIEQQAQEINQARQLIQQYLNV